jgi:uncharacterized membrane protein SpoIIM required for sporulation
MKLARFQRERREGWQALEVSLREAGGRAEKLGPDGVLRLGDLYRSAAADLAVARRTWPGDPVVTRLEGLVRDSRHLVYDALGKRGSIKSFYSRTYWRLIRERPAPLLLALFLLVVPSVLAFIWGLKDPAYASGVVPGSRGIKPGGGDLGLPIAEQATFAASIFTNNIQVTFLAFAAGIALGLGTAFVLVYNGLVLGTVAGIATDAGSGRAFMELVVAHGVLELSCVVVASAAGMRLGWALVKPGRLRRGDALKSEAQRTMQIILGTMPWLVLAGLVEGFVTPAGFGLLVNTTVGIVLGLIFLALLLWRGRPSTDALDA